VTNELSHHGIEKRNEGMLGRLRPIVVIKVGGSVLGNTAAYESCARFLARRLHRCSHDRFVVVGGRLSLKHK